MVIPACAALSWGSASCGQMMSVTMISPVPLLHSSPAEGERKTQDDAEPHRRASQTTTYGRLWPKFLDLFLRGSSVRHLFRRHE